MLFISFEKKDKRFPLLQKKFDDFKKIEELFPTKIPVNGKLYIDPETNFYTNDYEYFAYFDDYRSVIIYCSILYNDNMSSI